MLENLSTCKSPQQMFGAVAKTYYAGKMGIDPKPHLRGVVMPCTAKKFEPPGRDECERSQGRGRGADTGSWGA